MPDYIRIAEEAFKAAEEAGVSGEQDELEAAMRQRSISASLLVLIGLSERPEPRSSVDVPRGSW